MKDNMQLAEIQDLCRRTLSILEANDFFKCDEEGFWHSSLYNDLKRASDGKELSHLTNQYKLLVRRIKELTEDNNE